MIHADLAALDDIATGKRDAVLDRIIDAARARKRAVEVCRMQTLQPGDRIQIRDTRPKYLNGCFGNVIAVNQTTVTVKLYEAPDRKWAGSIRVPAGCVRLVPQP